MTKFPEKYNAADHIKAGFKAIKGTYKQLYNRPGADGGSGTAGANLRMIRTGQTSPGAPVQTKSTRAKVAALGVASVTPVGPIAAFAAGVKKSVAAKKQGQAIQAKIQATKAALAENPAPKATFKPATPKVGRDGAAPVIGKKSTFVKATPTAARDVTKPVIGRKLPPPPSPPSVAPTAIPPAPKPANAATPEFTPRRAAPARRT